MTTAWPAPDITAKLPAPQVSVVRPAPTQDEAVAITTAIELLWPKPAASTPSLPRRAAWRFSGRWWTRPVPARRARPWY